MSERSIPELRGLYDQHFGEFIPGQKVEKMFMSLDCGVFSLFQVNATVPLANQQTFQERYINHSKSVTGVIKFKLLAYPDMVAAESDPNVNESLHEKDNSVYK